MPNLGVLAMMLLARFLYIGGSRRLPFQNVKHHVFIRAGASRSHQRIASPEKRLTKPTTLATQGIRYYHSSSSLHSTTFVPDDDCHHDAEEKESRKTRSTDCVLSAVERAIENEILPCFQDQEIVTLIIGVSGGCDSVGLLHALVQLAHPKLELHAAHFDHRQRGVESDRDRQFVTELCRELGVRLHTYYWGDDSVSTMTTAAAPPPPPPPHCFSQNSARTWRRSTMYELLQSLTDQRGIIATAHHRDDSNETLLLKLLRGAHITNLVGMDAVVDDTKNMPQAVWARPLLELGKKDIQDFLTRQSFKWREDMSNSSNKYKRNRIRNELIPLLADIVGSEDQLEKRLRNLSTQAKEVRADLTQRANDHILHSGMDSSFFLLPDSPELSLVEREALYLWSAERMNGSFFSYEQLHRVCAQVERYPNTLQWTMQIGNGWSIVRNGASLAIASDTHLPSVDDLHSSKQVAIEWCVVEASPGNEENSDTVFIRTEDSPQVGTNAFRFSVSGRANHFPFTPVWRNKPIKVKEFLRGQKVPLHVRDSIPIILSTDDEKVVAIFVNDKWQVDAAFHRSNSAHQFRVKLTIMKDTMPFS